MREEIVALGAALTRRVPRGNTSGKKSSQFFFSKTNSFSRRRTPYADRKIDLRWFGRRPRRTGGAFAGETFRRPDDKQDQASSSCHAPTGRRRIMDRDSMPGDAFRRTDATQILGAKRGRRNALKTL
jgi:hypothetical protein